MCSLFRLTVAKNHNFGQILTFRKLLYRPPFTDDGQIWCAAADLRSTLTGQISSECVHCGGFRWPKTTIFGQMLTFLGAPVPTPFYQRGPDLVCYSRATVYVHLRNFVSIGLFCRPVAAKTPIFAVFAVFWTSAFSDVANCHQFQKVAHGCTTTNLPLSTGMNIVSVLQRLHGEIGRRISDVQKRDGRQTNRQKTQRFWPPRRRVKSEPTKLSMVIEDLEHVIALLKLLGSDAQFRR